MKHRTLSKDNSGSLQWIGVIAVVAIIVGLVFVAVFPAEEQEGLHVKNVTLQIKGQEDSHELTLQIPQEISMLQQTGVTGALTTASITEDTSIPEGSEVQVYANADIWWSSQDIASVDTVQWDQSATKSSGAERLKHTNQTETKYLTISQTISDNFQVDRSSTNPLTIGDASQWFSTYEYNDGTGWYRKPLKIEDVDGFTFNFMVTLEGQKINNDPYSAGTTFSCQINVSYDEVDASISITGEVTGMDTGR